MSGPATSPIFRWRLAFCIWWRSSIGPAGRFWPGACRTRWMRAFASRRSTKRWRGTARHEEVNVKDGRMVEGNFDEYPILRTGDTPQVNIHFGGLSGHDRFSELGEPPVGPVGPAVGNAIFRAIGKRIRSTPIRKHDLTWA